MAWKTMDIRDQRVRFVVAASRREGSLSELCREFGMIVGMIGSGHTIEELLTDYPTSNAKTSCKIFATQLRRFGGSGISINS